VSGGRLVRIGAVAGLVLGGVYATWLALEESRPGGAGLTPALALGLGYVAPFVVAGVGDRMFDPGVRRSVWLGCGALAGVLAVTSATGVTLPLLVPGVLIVLGAMQDHRAEGTGRARLDPGTALGIVGVGVISVVVVRVWADGYGAALAVLGWAGVGAWMLARLSMDRRRHLGVRP